MLFRSDPVPGRGTRVHIAPLELSGRLSDEHDRLVVDLLNRFDRHSERLAPIAADLRCTLAQMSLAWCLKNPHVSTVITGASRASQVVENMKAQSVVPLLTADVMTRIEAALAPA